MEGIELAALGLWAMAITLGGAVVVDGVGIAVGDDHELDVDVDTALASVGLHNLSEDGSPTGVLEADGIDEDTERHATTGFCAIGFDSNAAPVGFDVHGDSGEVHVDFDAGDETRADSTDEIHTESVNGTPTHTTPHRVTPDAVLDQCQADQSGE